MSEYKNEIDAMKWSFSRLTCFEQCKYQFYLNYLVHDDSEYLSEGNYWSEVGSFVHEILAMIFKGKLTVDDAAQYFVDHFDENVFYSTKESTMTRTFEACANYFAEADFSWLDNYEILGVEKSVRFKIGRYQFIGIIDLLLRDKRDSQLVIMDHKSCEYPFKKNGDWKENSKETFNKYKKQMYLYCHAIKKNYGEFPKEITWNLFKEGGKFATIPFSKEEYDEAFQWMIDTVHLIEQEEDFDANWTYFFCTNLCSFRHSCEY